MAETKKNAGAYQGFVRTEEAPLLPPPPSETGITGWLWQNVVSSCADFTINRGQRSLTADGGLHRVRCLADRVDHMEPGRLRLPVGCLERSGGHKEGGLLDRRAGGSLPKVARRLLALHHNEDEILHLWPLRVQRAVAVNLTGLIGLVGLVWVLIERLPYRRHVGVFLLTGYPLIAIILLTGGAFEVSYGFALDHGAFRSWSHFHRQAFAPRTAWRHHGDFRWRVRRRRVADGDLCRIMMVLSADVGLEAIDTNDWGGLLITLVVAVTGIVASLPLGIVLALGRRSNMPVARILSVVFIEFWRGVPLITVLFMASVMLPLFLPEGVNFNNLLRALIGVMLFSAPIWPKLYVAASRPSTRGSMRAPMLSVCPTGKNAVDRAAAGATHVIPGIVNTFIGLFKDTTLVSIIGLFDLLGAAQSTLADAAWASPVQGHTAYLFIAAVFFVFCFGMSRYSIFMENKLSRGRKH